MANTVSNPHIYTKDSFYYYFIWDDCTDVTKEYEVLLHNINTPYNNTFIVKYNNPVSFFDILNAYKDEGFTIEGLETCRFKIREKVDSDPEPWNTISTCFPEEGTFSVSLYPLNCTSTPLNKSLNQFFISTSPDLRNILRQNSLDNINPIKRYGLYWLDSEESYTLGSLPSYMFSQDRDESLGFIFNLYYNNTVHLNMDETLFGVNFYTKDGHHSVPPRQQHDKITTKIVPREEHQFIDFTEDNVIDTPLKQGANLMYIEKGVGWKIDDITLESGHTYTNWSSNETINFNGSNATAPLGVVIHGKEIDEQEIDFKNHIKITTGWKYAQQIDAFEDLKTIHPVAVDSTNHKFTYQYSREENHTPVFIYQKVLNNDNGQYEYVLTNQTTGMTTDSIIQGTLYFDGSSDSSDYIRKNDLIVTTSPVINYDYGSFSLNGNNYVHFDVQNYKKFIFSTIKIGSGLPSDHTSGNILIAYNDDFSFENAQIVNNGDVINVEDYDYINIKFVRDLGSGSSSIDYCLDDGLVKTLKREYISLNQLQQYTEEHQGMLNVNTVFNSLEESFNWDNFKIISDKGQPKIQIRAHKDDIFSDMYSYKVLIQNQMSNREFVNEELDFKYLALNSWCIYKNNTPYSDGYVLSDLVHNELSSKEKYHVIIKRLYNGDEYIIDERDVTYKNNTDFFLAPFNNINYNPGEETDFYFSTERNNSENAAQGYPWLIYNNKDNASYFCYSNQAYNNNADNRGIDNYDSNKSDNKQLIHINYHDKPNFTQKEVIPMLDFKITELVEQKSPYWITSSDIGNQTNVRINFSNSDTVNISSNGDNASFTIKPLIENGYISFAGDSNTIGGTGSIEVLDKETGASLYISNNFSFGEGSYFLKDKKVNNDTTLLFKLSSSNSFITFTNCNTKTLVQPDNSNTLLQKRKFYIDNFSINEIDYSQIENGSIISGQVLELHKPVTLHIEDFDDIPNNSIYYKIEKIDEYNQEIITSIDDDNSITLVQNNKDNDFTKDFYINSHTNQFKIQNTKTKQITFNNAQKDTIVNCVLEKEEEVEN